MKRFELLMEISGPPVGKGRPRVTRQGGSAWAYTPDTTRRWERKAKAVMAKAWDGREPLDEPVVLKVWAVCARPKRLLRKCDPDDRMPRTTKPDGDNVLKAVADALVKAGVLRDDALVVNWQCICLYAAREEEPKVEVRLTWLGKQSLKAA